MALLEVIFALALFAAGAATILSGVNACIRTAGRLKVRAVADDLAVTLLSEVQMRLVPIQDDGPNAYDEPYEDWSWEIVTSELSDVIDGPELTRVEIIIRGAEAAYTRRLTCLMPPDADDFGAELARGWDIAAAGRQGP